MSLKSIVVSFIALALVRSPLIGQEDETVKLPVEFPNIKLTVEQDQYVLCPPKLWIDQANEKGVDKQLFIYYTATMIDCGESHSRVKTLAGREEIIPNAMVIPIQAEESAEVGDIVLTWWQSGSGMNRAIVIGGSKTEPVVKYLDIAWDNPTGVAKEDHQLKPNSFHRLEDAWQPGTAIIVAGQAKFQYGQLLAVTEDLVMIKGQMGIIQVHPREKCTPIPITVDVSTGDQVYVPVFNTMTKATVDRVDKENGRVHVTYPFGGKDKQSAVPMGDVALELPQS